MTDIADVSSHTIADLVSLAGRVALVTGGARGLGKAIAARLAEAGARVVIADRDGELASAAATDLAGRFGVDVASAQMDVTDSATIAAAVQLAVDRFGGLDIWVNNAGIFPFVPLAQMTDEVWDDVMAVNGRGSFAGAREAARHMVAAGKGGVIVNVASTAGFRGVSPGLSAYVASKHAVTGLTKQLALELAPERIRVLGVAPTYCVTEGNIAAAQEAVGGDLNAAQEITAMFSSKLGRVGVPDDVARVVLFCASDMAMFMTGSTLLVDAGEVL
ncbi:SDR family NAD(P)-dependent oxidoreductase [Haliea sp. E17]|uniref:SDR family NAD(P)-dependent oxidoreductase n=1 Tax=Haliea sp. E17 TaxID=3401576 RepID=UPI003AAA7BB8